MLILKVTPVRNVLLNERRFRNESLDFFFNKILNEGSQIDVYDVEERTRKLVNVSEINALKHRMMINDKKYFICSMKKENSGV